MSSSKFGLRGALTVTVRNARTQRVVFSQTIKNTITYDGMLGVLRLLGQDGVTLSDFQVASIRVGEGLTPPDREDVGLVAPVFTMGLTSSNRSISVSTRELVVSATLGVGDANGRTLTEAAWFYANGTMGGRQLTVPIPKSSGITATYTWRLGVTGD